MTKDGVMMSGDPQAVEQLAEHIQALPTENLETELEGLLQGGEHSLLTRTIAASEPDASIGLIGAVVKATESVATLYTEKPRIKAALGRSATGALIGALGEGPLGTTRTALNVASKAEYLAGLIQEDPATRASTLAKISEQLAGDISRQEDITSGDEFTAATVYYLDKAAEVAHDISDASERAHAFIELGEQSVNNLGLAEGSVQKLGTYGFLRGLASHPAKLYREAFGAVSEEANPEKQADATIDIILSMAGSVLKINTRHSPEVASELTDSTRNRVYDFLDKLKKDPLLSRLTASKKVQKLIHLGAKLTQAVEMPADHDTRDSNPILNRAALQVFRAAQEHARSIRTPLWMRPRLPGSRKLKGVGTTTAIAAGRVLNDDFAMGKELLEISFGLAAVEDTYKGYGLRTASNDVLSEITTHAKRQKTSTQGLELFSLAHRLAIRDGNIEEDQRSKNVQEAILFLPEVFLSSGIAIEKIDNNGFLVEAMIEEAAHSGDPHQLRKLFHYVEDPALEQRIDFYARNKTTEARERAMEKEKAKPMSVKLAEKAIEKS